MKPGLKLYDKDGVQVAVFPSQQIYITQGANSPYSHAYTKNMDNACYSDKRKIYAPVDVKCVANDYASGLGLVLYQSVNKVRLANGDTDYLSMWLMHDNNARQWQVGRVYKQGEHIYTEGNADPTGLTTGIHVHYEVAIGLHSERIKSHPNGRWHIVNQVHPDQVFFKNETELLRSNAEGSWAGDHYYEWKDFDGETSGGGGGTDPLPSQFSIVDNGYMDLKEVFKMSKKYEVVGVDKDGTIKMRVVEDNTYPSDFHKENGKFITNRAVNVRTKPSTSASIIDTVSRGSSFYYDGYKVSGGYVWVTGIYNGKRAYMAWRVHNGEKYGECYFV